MKSTRQYCGLQNHVVGNDRVPTLYLPKSHACVDAAGDSDFRSIDNWPSRL